MPAREDNIATAMFFKGKHGDIVAHGDREVASLRGR